MESYGTIWNVTGEPATVTSYISEDRIATKFKKFLSTKSLGWRESKTKYSIRLAVTDKLKKKMAVPERSRKYVSNYWITEQKLVLKLIEKRSRKARVSSLWIRTTAKNLASEEYPGSDFKESNGWLFRFLRRYKIRFRKCKNQKAVSAEEKRAKLQ